MKAYNPREWYKVLFLFNKSDTFRKLLPLIICVIIYSIVVAWVEANLLHLSSTHWSRNIPVMHSLLGFVISMLLVFRTNTAYDRWWEGRKQWGALVNNSRNLAMKLSAILPEADQDNRVFFRDTIALYAAVLKDHLQAESTRMMLDELPHPELETIDHNKHIPNQVAAAMIRRTQQLYRDGRITGDQLITINPELMSFTDICGACERIKNTPIPFSYSSFIKKFITVYILTLPLGYVFLFGYYSALVVAFVFYVLASLELVAEEIEEPFGKDPNDLPMEKMAWNIKKHVSELIIIN